jgi:methylated-DNA-[protein]-cysteine S-methyltransferase
MVSRGCPAGEQPIQAGCQVPGLLSRRARPSGRGAEDDDTDLPPLHIRVYGLCRQIPAGKVITYGSLARLAMCTPRMVGQVMKQTPDELGIPAHRVVAASGRIGGYGGTAQRNSAPVRLKAAMLVAEGVVFTDRGLIHPDCLLYTLPA